MTATITPTGHRIRPATLRQAATDAYEKAAALAARARAEREEQRRADEVQRLLTRVRERWGLEAAGEPIAWQFFGLQDEGLEHPVLVLDWVRVASGSDGRLLVQLVRPDGELTDWHQANSLVELGQVLSQADVEASPVPEVAE